VGSRVYDSGNNKVGFITEGLSTSLKGGTALILLLKYSITIYR